MAQKKYNEVVCGNLSPVAAKYIGFRSFLTHTRAFFLPAPTQPTTKTQCCEVVIFFLYLLAERIAYDTEIERRERTES